MKVLTVSKSPILAFILSIVPGLGHIYAMGAAGIPRALAFAGGVGLSLVLCLLLIGFIMTPIVWIWCAVDAMGITHLVNQGDIKNTTFGV
jgi:hypothetical protein